MKRTTVAILGAGLSFVTMQSASAQKTVNQYGNTFTVTQPAPTTTDGNFNTGLVRGTEGNDTLQTLVCCWESNHYLCVRCPLPEL